MDEPSSAVASQQSAASNGRRIRDTQYEINAVLNNLVKEIFMEQDGSEEIDFQQVNVHVLNQVFTMLVGEDLQAAQGEGKKKPKK